MKRSTSVSPKKLGEWLAEFNIQENQFLFIWILWKSGIAHTLIVLTELCKYCKAKYCANWILPKMLFFCAKLYSSSVPQKFCKSFANENPIPDQEQGALYFSLITMRTVAPAEGRRIRTAVGRRISWRTVVVGSRSRRSLRLNRRVWSSSGGENGIIFT